MKDINIFFFKLYYYERLLTLILLNSHYRRVWYLQFSHIVLQGTAQYGPLYSAIEHPTQ